MANVSSSIHINKPIEEVFEYAASPFNGPTFIPNLNENQNIKPEKSGAGQTFDWRFNLAGVDLKGQAEVTEFEPPHRVKMSTTGDTTSSWIFTFQEENGGTRVRAEVDYKISENFLKRMANKMIIDRLNQRSAEQMLENLKIILES